MLISNVFVWSNICVNYYTLTVAERHWQTLFQHIYWAIVSKTTLSVSKQLWVKQYPDFKMWEQSLPPTKKIKGLLKTPASLCHSAALLKSLTLQTYNYATDIQM